ncbi:MAG: ImmA/IrrE family metallo-endopeptidase [Candidatus Ornithomonoglobus sp.]
MYTNYNNYKKVRDLSWEILIRFNISSLPVDIFSICHKAGIMVYTYRQNKELIDRLGLAQHVKNNDGFSTTINKRYVIFYDDTIIPSGRAKFTLAHELGHILLRHITKDNVVTRWNRGEETPHDPRETAANQFAARLLAPACILRELNVQTVDELRELTGLSYTAAGYRLQRLEELRKRNKFYLSPLERRVKNQFNNFINTYKNRKDDTR